MITRYRLCLTAFVSLLLCTSCDSVQGPGASQPEPLPACDPVQPRPPCEPKPTDPALVRAIEVVDGDMQVANTGTPLPRPLIVLVTTRNKASLPNIAVNWSSSPDVSLSHATTVTDANGIARNQLTLGSNAGEFTTVATVEGTTSAFVYFTSRAQKNGAFKIKEQPQTTISQTDTVFTQLAYPYKVTIVDYTGEPVGGVPVEWTLSGGGVLSASASTTDENGVAQVSHRLGPRVGLEVVQASVPGLVNSPYFFLTEVKPGRPVSLSRISGGGRLGVVKLEIGEPYIVRVADSYGNAADAAIDWIVELGGGTLRLINPATALHTLGPVVGPQSVVASLPGTSQRVTFTANAVSMIVSAGDPYCYGEPSFYPNDVVIPIGGVVAWGWYPNFCYSVHNVTFEDNPDPPVSSGTHAEAIFTRAFNAPGIFRYRCTLHSTSFSHGEVGVVKVE